MLKCEECKVQTDMSEDYPNEEVKEFAESDHRLAGAEPYHQPDDDEDEPHRLDGAQPAKQRE